MPLPDFGRGLSLNGNGMQPGSNFFCDERIDCAMTVHPAHAFKRLGNNLDPQMGFTASVKTFLMTCMQVTLVDDLKRKRLQGCFNFFVNVLRKSHFRQSFVANRRAPVNRCQNLS